MCTLFFCTNAQVSSSKYNLQIINVNTENYPEAIFVEFTVTNEKGGFVPNLTVDDFIVKDNGTKKYGCKRLVQDLSELRLPVDIVFLVDNSYSMNIAQDKINNAIPLLLNGLKDKGDIRVALARFGDQGYTSYYKYNPEKIIDEWATIEKSEDGFAFFPLRNYEDLKYFQDSIWIKRNKYDGSIEPYYNVLDWVAQQDLGYRHNALKVFILLGDGTYYTDHGVDNNSICDLSQEYVAKTLSTHGIQTFVIQRCDTDKGMDYRNEYEYIIKETKGGFYDITSENYDGILTNITDKIKGRYILRYCVEEDEELNECKDVKESSVLYEGEEAIRQYYPIKTATIERTLETQYLDSISIPENNEITLSSIVHTNGNDIEKVSLFYRSSTNNTYKELPKDSNKYDSAPSLDDFIYSFAIPDSNVIGDYISYYFEVETSVQIGEYKQSTKITSPAYTHDFFAWNIAIGQHEHLKIFDVQTQFALPCQPLIISANVSGERISTVTLNYRIADIPTVYRQIPMANSTDSDLFMGRISSDGLADKAIEYFITATDSSGIQAHYGTPEKPYRIDIDELTIASRKDPMEIIIYGLDRITIGCNPITEKDTIAAYYPMRCGGAVTDVLCSYATWDKLIKGFRLTVYGTSNNSNVKNGFEKGDDIKLKLIQNGIDYILENHNIKYSPNARITDFPYIAIGPKEPKASFNIENKQIERDSDIDFGLCDRETTKIITLKNTGCENLYIRDITLDNELFEIKSFETEADKEGILKILAPGESVNIDISYTPTFDANATLEIHTNIPSDHIYRFTLSGKSLTVSPCATLKMQPLTPKYGESISLTFDSRQEKEIEILLKKECSYKVDWSYTLTPSVSTQEVQIDKLLEIGHYKLSFYSGDNLCEYLFEVIE